MSDAITVSGKDLQCNNRTIRGIGNTVRGNNNSVFGSKNTVIGNNTNVTGRDNTIHGSAAKVSGHGNTVYGDCLEIDGYNNTIYGKCRTVNGLNNKARSGNDGEPSLVAPTPPPPTPPPPTGSGDGPTASVQRGIGRLMDRATQAMTAGRPSTKRPRPTIVPTFPTIQDEFLDVRVGEDDPIKCSICFDNKPKCAIVPCGHRQFCITCIRKICETKERRCPTCRKIIDMAIITYD